jgi:hypothetical protein
MQLRRCYHLLALTTVLGSSLHTNAMNPEKDRRPIEPIFNNSDIQKQKQKKAGFILLGIGGLALLSRRPITAFCFIIGGGTALMGGRCKGIKEMENGLSTIRKEPCTDKMIQGATELVTGCGYFANSLFWNGVGLVREAFPEKTTEQEAQSKESDE